MSTTIYQTNITRFDNAFTTEGTSISSNSNFDCIDIAASTQYKSLCCTDIQFKYAKKKQAMVILGDTNGKGRKSEHIKNRSGIALDIEPKNEHQMTIEQGRDWMSSLGLQSKLYTTFSDTGDNLRFRIFIPIGEEIESKERYSQLVQWFISNTDQFHAIDPASTSWSQLMALPNAYRHEPTVIMETQGVPFNQHKGFNQSVTQRIAAITPNNKAKGLYTPMIDAISVKADKMFTKQVHNLHPSIIPSMRHGDSYRFKRNAGDIGDGLYSLQHHNRIIDPSRDHRSYQLTYSADDFQECIDTEHLQSDAHRNMQQALRWEDSDIRCGLIQEPTGSGKSNTLKLLATRKDKASRIFAFATLDGRDKFSDDVDELTGVKDYCLTIFSGLEIALDCTNVKMHDRIKEAFVDFYEVDEDDISNPSKKRVGFKRFIKTHLTFVSGGELDLMMAKHEINMNNMLNVTTRPLLMSQKKLECVVSYGKLGADVFNTNAKAYGSQRIIYSDEFESGSLCQSLTDMNIEEMVKLKRCHVSAEYTAQLEIEHKHNKHFVTRIGTGLYKQRDKGLYVLRVNSTKYDEGVRQALFDEASKHFDAVICNRVGSEHNFVNVKGDNQFRETEMMCSIITKQEKSRVYRMMTAIGSDDFEYVLSLLVGGDVTQSLGRNMKNRNKSGRNKHLLVIPNDLPIRMEFVTENVFRGIKTRGKTDCLSITDVVAIMNGDVKGDVMNEVDVLNNALDLIATNDWIETGPYMKELGLTTMDIKSFNKLISSRFESKRRTKLKQQYFRLKADDRT